MAETLELEYYKETSRPKRKELLDQMIAKNGLTQANILRQKLYIARYGSSEKNNRELDIFIHGWMTLEFIKSSKNTLRSTKKLQREGQSVLSDFQHSLIKEYGALGEEIIYQEYCNLTRLYLKLCEKDRSYGSVLLGLGRLNSDSFEKKVYDDIFRIAYVIPGILGIKDELASFSKAASYIFCQQYPTKADAFYKRVLEETDYPV